MTCLKPCPWCGEPPRLKPCIDGGVCLSHDGGCDFVDGLLFFDSVDEAEAAWNAQPAGVVTCAECALAEDYPTWGWVCKRFECEWHTTEPDGYCAWGERAEP